MEFSESVRKGVRITVDRSGVACVNDMGVAVVTSEVELVLSE